MKTHKKPNSDPPPSRPPVSPGPTEHRHLNALLHPPSRHKAVTQVMELLLLTMKIAETLVGLLVKNH